MITITEADLKRFAPKAKREYVQALVGGLYALRTASILENSYRICHFLAQCAHETGGFTIVRENMNYSIKRMREVWPARFRDKPDHELKPLANNPRALADAVYLGRMGNTQPGDGYDFRGGGFLQCTGRGAVAKYCEVLGLDPSPHLLDDIPTTLQFAIVEWTQARCNELADQNDLLAISKAINVGSATSNVIPVGLESRKKWFARAWAIWGEKGKPDTPAETMSLSGALVKIGAPVLAVGEGVRQAAPYIPPVPPWVTETITNVHAWKGVAQQVSALGSEAVVAGGAGAATAATAYAVLKKWLVRS